MSDASDRDRLAFLVHEVRSPVGALAAIAKAYTDRGLEHGERLSLVELTLAACRAIERVVGDAAATSIRPEDVDLGRLARDSVAAAVLAGANVRAAVGEGSTRVRADPVRIRQAFDNLVANALAYSPEGSEVVVIVMADDDVVRVSVSDEGRGIAEEDLERIFETGVRLAGDGTGSGLGLAVSRAIAVAHGGTLSVESAPGRGSTFTLALPRGR
jgi:two-component system sensor histidine kinase SenX3